MTWNSTYQTLFNEQQILQSKAIKIIQERKWNSKVLNICLIYKILTVHNFYLFEVGKLASLIYRLHNNRLP